MENTMGKYDSIPYKWLQDHRQKFLHTIATMSANSGHRREIIAFFNKVIKMKIPELIIQDEEKVRRLNLTRLQDLIASQTSLQQSNKIKRDFHKTINNIRQSISQEKLSLGQKSIEDIVRLGSTGIHNTEFDKFICFLGEKHIGGFCSLVPIPFLQANSETLKKYFSDIPLEFSSNLNKVLNSYDPKEIACYLDEFDKASTEAVEEIIGLIKTKLNLSIENKLIFIQEDHPLSKIYNTKFRDQLFHELKPLKIGDPNIIRKFMRGTPEFAEFVIDMQAQGIKTTAIDADLKDLLKSSFLDSLIKDCQKSLAGSIQSFQGTNKKFKTQINKKLDKLTETLDLSIQKLQLIEICSQEKAKIEKAREQTLKKNIETVFDSAKKNVLCLTGAHHAAKKISNKSTSEGPSASELLILESLPILSFWVEQKHLHNTPNITDILQNTQAPSIYSFADNSILAEQPYVGSGENLPLKDFFDGILLIS